MRTRVKGGILIPGALIICAIVVFSFRPRRDSPPPEVNRSELVLVDGKLRLKNSPLPFTGIMLERYPGGVLQSRSSILDGSLHGLSEGFYTNGQVQVTEHFNHGVSHGPRTKWYIDGRKMSEATIENGKLQGAFTRWHENGKIAEQIRLRDGQPDGTCTAWHPDGSLKAEATLQNGKVIQQKFWNPGEANSAQTHVKS